MHTNIWYWIILLILILLVAFFAAAETSFASLNMIRIKNLAKNGNKAADRTQKLSNNFEEILATVLIGNNIASFSAATLSAILFLSLDIPHNALISTIVVTFVLLAFGDVLPKNYAKNHAESTALATTPLLKLFIILLKPLSWFFVKMQQFPGGIEKDISPTITEEELKVIVQEIKEEGVLEGQESELVQSALDFDETTAGDILTPRVDVISINISEDVESIKDIFVNQRYSRLPVYEDNKDNVIGVLYQKDFFKSYLDETKTNIKSLMSPPLFVPPTMKISELLKALQRAKTHLALVADQYGGIDGIITLEDVLEELVGEIYDEDDEINQDVLLIKDNLYRVNANIKLDDLLEQIEYEPIEKPLDQTVGAWVLEVFEKIPLEGDNFEYEKIKLEVEKMNEQRIISVLISK